MANKAGGMDKRDKRNEETKRLEQRDLGETSMRNFKRLQLSSVVCRPPRIREGLTPIKVASSATIITIYVVGTIYIVCTICVVCTIHICTVCTIVCTVCTISTASSATSRHSVPSPDGRLIATLLPTLLEFVSVETLQTVEEITLPFDESLYGQVCAFAWSPSSSRLLVALPDQVHVFCAQDPDYHAVVRLGASAGTRPALVRFGARDSELCVCTGFGLKLALFDLASSKSVEIANPKMHHVPSASRGISFRPKTSHLAVLSRSNGKDVVSVHNAVTREVEASWYPDTVDAQSVEWTPDGRWLVVAESASQGKKLLLFTPDGNLFRNWSGAAGVAAAQDSQIDEMGAGIRHAHVKGDLISICDHSRRITILDAAMGSEAMAFVHPTLVHPRDTLQVWHERLDMSTQPPTHTFTRATQSFSPPSRALSGDESKPGCSVSELDSSTTLLASRLDDSDSTLWIWDVRAAELRAVLVFHAAIASFAWHPRIPELLMMTCTGDAHRDVVFVWNPLSGGPQPIKFGALLPNGKVAGKPHSAWIDLGGETAALQVGDWVSFMLVALAEPGEAPAAWEQEKNWRRSAYTFDPLATAPDDGPDSSDLDSGASEPE